METFPLASVDDIGSFNWLNDDVVVAHVLEVGPGDHVSMAFPSMSYAVKLTPLLNMVPVEVSARALSDSTGISVSGSRSVVAVSEVTAVGLIDGSSVGP